MSMREWEDEQKPVEVWPENVQAYELWKVVGDQWRMSMAGPVALDLIPVFHQLDRMNLPHDEYDDLLWAVRAMASFVMEHNAQQ